VTAPPIPAWLDKLKRRFSPARIRVGTEGGRPLPGGGGSGVLALVGRGLCLFLTVDASRVPPRQRAGFVNLAVRRAAPFADPEHDVLWSGGHAAVWYWSRSRVRSLLARTGNGPLQFRAEALFHGQAHDGDGIDLIAFGEPGPDDTGDAGVEARVWRAGRLQASRWWPAAPDVAAWASFARGAGLDARLAQPEVQPSPLHERPLSSSSQRPTLGTSLRDWRTRAPLIVAGAGGLAAMAFVWQLAGLARTHWEVARVEERIARVSAHLEPVITARERADRAQAEIARLLALRPPSSQTRLLAEIKRVTPGSWQLHLWNQPSPDILEVTLKAASPDVPAIVSAWEKSPLLQDVTPATSGRADELKLQARLTPWDGQTP
jgi:hypothetical protein